MLGIAKEIEKLEFLDKAAKVSSKIGPKLVPEGQIKDLLTGKWLGHPVHPMLTDVTIGLFIGAVTLDVLGGKKHSRSAQRLTLLGIASSLPTAWAGLADYVDTIGPQRRVGTVHAVGNATALNLFCRSCAARRRQDYLRAAAYSVAGAGVMAGSGYLGGHLAHHLGVGVDHTAFEQWPDEWTPVLDSKKLPQKTMTKVSANGTDVLLYRQGEEICAISNTCTHRGGALDEGDAEAGTVTCPLHASKFDLCTGKVIQGPASSPQPSYEARVNAGKIELKPKQ
ncbi:MAG: Rieske 2Fe-2S domain-containing protein [Actinobacteria bacterium]|nr:Rieske 2Fe-2S domain-containing protein [Actinomycetota bacterium]